MGTSLLDGKRLLAVDDEPDILDVLREDLEKYGVALDTASSYEEGFQKMTSYTYDLVILDIMGVRGFDLLMFATSQNTPVVMLTAHALNPESLKKSIELGARAYLPKDEIDRIAPFVEDVLTLTYQAAWKSLFEKPASNPLQTTSGGQAASISAKSVTNNCLAAIPVYYICGC